MDEENRNIMDIVDMNMDMKSLLMNAKEGWKEALQLASYRQGMVDSKAREMELLNQKYLESDKTISIIIDEINIVTLQLANEVISRQALNENTNYANITMSSSSSSSSSSSKGNITDSLGIILQRLKTINSMISTQDLLLNKSRDDVKKMHALFVAEKREREAKEREERMEKEEIERIREQRSREQFEASFQQPRSCESITEETSSVLTEDTSSVTKKKVKKKVVKK